MAADDPKFTCTACGKEYRWKPELAGRKAKCGCGAALVVPTERPGAGPLLESAPPIAIVVPAALTRPAPVAAPAAAPPVSEKTPAGASGATCPICGASLAPNAVLCVNCGYNLKTGKTLSVVVEQKQEDDDQPAGTAPPTTANLAPRAAKSAKSAKPAP